MQLWNRIERIRWSRVSGFDVEFADVGITSNHEGGGDEQYRAAQHNMKPRMEIGREGGGAS